MFAGIDFKSLTFGEPIHLWLLVFSGVLLVLWLWQVWRRRRDARRCARDRVLPVRERFTLAGDLAFWFCLIIAASFCILALARPQIRTATITEGGADIVILQDGSASMATQDVAPDRWRRSTQFLHAFADALNWKGDRVALAIFAHSAAPQTRLTNDPNALFFFLDHLGDASPFRIDQDPTWDTNIEEGLIWGLHLVEADEQLYGKSNNAKAFVVISDGQAWSGDVAAQLTVARQRNQPVFVIGVGTPEGGPIPGPPIGYVEGVPLPPVQAVLDRDSLRQIALAGGGEYFELGRDPDRDIALHIIESVRRRSTGGQEVDTYQDFYWRFLLAAGVFLCLGTVLLKASTELWWQAAVAVAALAMLAGAIH